MTPALLLVFLLVVTYRKFRFSTFVYVMAFLHALLLVYGAHFTYSQNPLFNQWKEQFDWERNYFDRVGHFRPRLRACFYGQGVPAARRLRQEGQDAVAYRHSVLSRVQCSL